MARAQKLKVFRTPIGFHDAYVAAPSQKAALEAWGADTNLFASGAAERVEQLALMEEPLAKPGTVIKRLRGTLAEHLAALPEDKGGTRKKGERERERTAASGSVRAEPAKRAPPKPKPKPRPSRRQLDEAETALDEIENVHRAALDDLSRRQAQLDRERQGLEKLQAREIGAVQRRLTSAREKYEKAMAAWRAT